MDLSKNAFENITALIDALANVSSQGDIISQSAYPSIIDNVFLRYQQSEIVLSSENMFEGEWLDDMSVRLEIMDNLPFKLKIKYNTVNCGCDVYDLLRYSAGNVTEKLKDSVFIDSDDLTCTIPLELAGKFVKDLKFDTFECDHYSGVLEVSHHVQNNETNNPKLIPGKRFVACEQSIMF